MQWCEGWCGNSINIYISIKHSEIVIIYIRLKDIWRFPKIGVPPNGWVYNGKSNQNEWFRGIPISGNLHIYTIPIVQKHKLSDELLTTRPLVLPRRACRPSSPPWVQRSTCQGWLWVDQNAWQLLVPRCEVFIGTNLCFQTIGIKYIYIYIYIMVYLSGLHR